jgi:hypothetical protein
MVRNQEQLRPAFAGLGVQNPAGAEKLVRGSFSVLESGSKRKPILRRVTAP